MWWTGFLFCLVFGVYALSLGVVETLALLGVMHDAKPRAVPAVFVLHALTGGIALIAGVLQLHPSLQQRRHLHRLIGRSYVWSTCLASIAGLWSAVFYPVPLAAKLGFGLVAILWFGTTTIGFHRIVAGRTTSHREWMLRSFALAFFFVTSGLWMPALEASPVPPAVGYPLSIFLGWMLNLLVAEAWIRYSRPRALTPQLFSHPLSGRGWRPSDVGPALRRLGAMRQAEP